MTISTLFWAGFVIAICVFVFWAVVYVVIAIIALVASGIGWAISKLRGM